MKKKTFFEYINKVFWWIAAIAILCMAIGSSVDITRRWITGQSWPWMISFCECCMAVTVWASIMPTQRMKGHVNVTIFTSKMSPKWQKIMEIFAALIGAVFLAAVCAMSYKQGMWAYSRHMYRAGDYTRFPIWWAYLFVTLGCFVMVIQLVIETVQGIIDLAKGNFIPAAVEAPQAVKAAAEKEENT